MNATAVASKPDVAPLRSERIWHVFILCAFAFSEPLFAALNQQFVYLHDIQAGWTEVAFVLILLTLVIPTFVAILDLAVLRVSRWWGGFGQDSILSILVFVVSLSVLRPFLRIRYLILESVVWLVTLAIAIPISAAFMFLYRRSPWMRYWLSLTALGLICFPGMFAYQFAMLRQSDVRKQSERDADRIPVKNPVPVIFVVFDEFSGTTLMNSDLTLDSKHFPQFARLGQMSTWYRNASTVYCRTDLAVPAMLSGQFKTFDHPALEAEYPGNLFQTIERTGAYEMTVFEPITRLCPNSLKQREQHPRTFLWKSTSLIKTMVAVYPRLILPDDTPIPFPSISRIWFGLPENLISDETARSGLIRHLPFIERDNQLQQFIDCLNPTDRPLFGFLHVELPHMPWYFLPSGRHYNYEAGAEFHPLGSWGDLGEDWDADAAIVARSEHRYLLQARYVDRFIGRLLDHLQETKLLDQALLIVTADHGLSFRPNHSRRDPDSVTLPEILSVPLFVKLPGQKTAKISDLNVESVDILPTISEVLGFQLSEPVDGTSLNEDKRRLRKTFYLDRKMMPLEAVIPNLEAAVRRRRAIFGDGSWESPPVISASHPEWHGRQTREFEMEDRPLPGLRMFDQTDSPDLGASEFVRLLVHGILDPKGISTPFADLVVAVNGVIHDTGRSSKRGHGMHGFEFLLPEAAIIDQSSPVVELFLVEQPPSGKARLRRIATL